MKKKPIQFEKVTSCRHLESVEDEMLAIQFYRFDMEMVEYEKDKNPKRLLAAKKILETIHTKQVAMVRKLYANKQSRQKS